MEAVARFKVGRRWVDEPFELLSPPELRAVIQAVLDRCGAPNAAVGADGVPPQPKGPRREHKLELRALPGCLPSTGGEVQGPIYREPPELREGEGPRKNSRVLDAAGKLPLALAPCGAVLACGGT